jgi:beta-lactam-binding protein with PASTA domain
VIGLRLVPARAKIRRNHCTVGRVTRKHARVTAGRVIGQSPRAHTHLAQGTRVKLVVSSGRR